LSKTNGGPVLSHHEFEGVERMADSEWKEQLQGWQRAAAAGMDPELSGAWREFEFEELHRPEMMWFVRMAWWPPVVFAWESCQWNFTS
jgi:hypothetical protein